MTSCFRLNERFVTKKLLLLVLRRRCPFIDFYVLSHIGFSMTYNVPNKYFRRVLQVWTLTFCGAATSSKPELPQFSLYAQFHGEKDFYIWFHLNSSDNYGQLRGENYQYFPLKLINLRIFFIQKINSVAQERSFELYNGML